MTRAYGHLDLTKISVLAARNLGIAQAKGEFIAIMDDDDINHPDRFQKQVNYLEKNPSVMILGTNMIKIDGDGYKKGEISFPTTNGQIRWGLIFTCSIANGSIMLRSILFNKLGFSYDENFKSCRGL